MELVGVVKRKIARHGSYRPDTIIIPKSMKGTAAYLCLIEKYPVALVRTLIEMECPLCHYHYWIEIFEIPEYEKCPNCGCFKKLSEFDKNKIKR